MKQTLVSTVMWREVVTARPDDTLSVVVSLLCNHGVHPIVDPGIWTATRG
jgi:predicted transcriptional regulator